MTENEKKVFDILTSRFKETFCGTDEPEALAKQIVESLSLPGVSGSCGYTKDETEIEEYWMTDCEDGFYTYKGEYNFCPHCRRKANYR